MAGGGGRGMAAFALVAGLLGATGVHGATHARAAQPWQRLFFSPSGNLGCELDNRRDLTRVYCQSWTPPHAVRMNRHGFVLICNRESCLGNPPDGVPTVPYGHSITLRPFRCTSLTAGIRCVVLGSGRGFLINRGGVHSLG